MRRIALWALLIFSLFVDGTIANAGLVNGSFENTGGTFIADGNGAMSLNPGSTTIPGWTVTTGELAWISTGSFGIAASDGSFFLDLAGYHDAFPYGGVSQSVATTSGNAYLLTFDIGNAGINTISQIQASAGATTSLLSAQNATGVAEWYTKSLNFTATASSTLIQLVGMTASNGGNYIGLDNVTLTDLGPTGPAPVPEPASLTVWGLGLVGFAGMACRKRKLAA